MTALSPLPATDPPVQFVVVVQAVLVAPDHVFVAALARDGRNEMKMKREKTIDFFMGSPFKKRVSNFDRDAEA
jgi:hypothetical protein